MKIEGSSFSNVYIEHLNENFYVVKFFIINQFFSNITFNLFKLVFTMHSINTFKISRLSEFIIIITNTVSISFINSFMSAIVKNEDSISYRNVKWSVRLYFYVCYGLYGNLFIQFIRKKDQTSINRDFLLSIIFYLRLHPSLFPEKNDSEKQLKYNNDDLSLEWRQYCLDPMCTNYNSSVQKLLKSSPATLNSNLSNCFLFNDHQFSIASHENLLNQPASPSYIFSSNRKCFVENEATSKRTFSAQSSIPSTPTPMVNQAFQFPLIECFPFDANQQDKKQFQNLDSNLSKNLTSHFMNEQIDSTQTLFHDSTESNKSQAQIRLCNKKKSFSEPNLNIDFEKSDCYLRHKQVKSEMKDTNINQPCEFGFDLFPKKLSNTPITTDSSTNTCDDDNIFSSQKSLLNHNTSESSDIVNAYIMGLSHNAKETDSNETIARLKQEINHLVIQLIYERNLRNRYEEDSNRLHFIKIERDQLVTEKRFLEKNLKQQVEGYKNEVEECISIQNKSEIKAYKEELDQKNEKIKNCFVLNKSVLKDIKNNSIY
ncbi:hypothetical protein BpHYR1_034019 [Brachionus plicatilis]|uniref:Uncharacterized protein n=1 Tax=Brachionus plicatilis TaxID=10195 RepID=A0A3M7PHR9_BRAPC|nr:hypothetical protein BpHYR1_034019 [Brachionus plicatilis]